MTPTGDAAHLPPRQPLGHLLSSQPVGREYARLFQGFRVFSRMQKGRALCLQMSVLGRRSWGWGCSEGALPFLQPRAPQGSLSRGPEAQSQCYTGGRRGGERTYREVVCLSREVPTDHGPRGAGPWGPRFTLSENRRKGRYAAAPALEGNASVCF